MIFDVTSVVLKGWIYVFPFSLDTHISNEPRREKTSLRDFRPSPTQTDWYNFDKKASSKLEISDLRQKSGFLVTRLKYGHLLQWRWSCKPDFYKYLSNTNAIKSISEAHQKLEKPTLW